jgi:hypothetical protein
MAVGLNEKNRFLARAAKRIRVWAEHVEEAADPGYLSVIRPRLSADRGNWSSRCAPLEASRF